MRRSLDATYAPTSSRPGFKNAERCFQQSRSCDLPTYFQQREPLRGRKLDTDTCVYHEQSNEFLNSSPAWPSLLLVVPLCLPLASFRAHRFNSSAIPLRVASSSSGVSTAAAGRCTYLTTLPRMKTFLTELCQRHISTRSKTCALRSALSRVRETGLAPTLTLLKVRVQSLCHVLRQRCKRCPHFNVPNVDISSLQPQ